MDEDDIDVDCKKLTKDGTLHCYLDMKTVTEMVKRGIKPVHIQINVLDKLPDSSQSAVEKESIGKIQHTETDSLKKQECGCSKTAESFKTGSSEAKNFSKSEEN